MRFWQKIQKLPREIKKYIMERHKLKIAVYLFLIKGDEIFLTRRFQTGWQDGNYTVPSGHLDPNETIIEAAIRETKEEAGIILDSANMQLVHTMHRMNIYIDFFFVCKNWQGEPSNTEPEKCDDAKWFLLAQLPNNMVPSVRHAIEQYQKGITFSEFINEG